MKPSCYTVPAPRGSFELAKKGDPLVYRKELAYPGRFTKVNPETKKEEFELPVTDTLLDHWVNTFSEMNKNGVDVPVPIGHTTDPEARRGTVVDLKKEYNPARKCNALYAYVKFRDEQTANDLRNSNVSLFMPPEFTDGKKRRYIRPIRHVAITDYPVIPGLDSFKPVAASFYELSLSEDDAKMTIAELAEKMGVAVPDGADDDAAAQAILEAWDASEESGDDEEPAVYDGSGEAPVEDDEDMSALGDDFADDDSGDEPPPRKRRDEEEDEETPPAMSFSMPPTLVRQVVRARRLEIDNLVQTRRISKPVADKLKTKYASDEAISVALSHEFSGSAGDGFDDLMATLALNAPVAASGEQTGRQTVPRAGAKNSLLEDAKQRAARAKRR